jgi:hypothetical protein
MNNHNDLRARAEQLRQATPTTPRRPPPEDHGKRLATLPRGDGEEIRVSWDVWENRPFLSIRLWTRNSSGEWWPSREKGIAIRTKELATFADGVAGALDELEALKGVVR